MPKQALVNMFSDAVQGAKRNLSLGPTSNDSSQLTHMAGAKRPASEQVVSADQEYMASVSSVNEAAQKVPIDCPAVSDPSKVDIMCFANIFAEMGSSQALINPVGDSLGTITESKDGTTMAVTLLTFLKIT